MGRHGLAERRAAAPGNVDEEPARLFRKGVQEVRDDPGLELRTWEESLEKVRGSNAMPDRPL